jgi:hypothetical protein
MKHAPDEVPHITLSHTLEEKARYYWVTLPLLVTVYESRTSETVLTSMRINLTAPLFSKTQTPTIVTFLHQKHISYEQFALMVVRRVIEEANIVEKVRKTHPDAWFDLVLEGKITWPKELENT